MFAVVRRAVSDSSKIETCVPIRLSLLQRSCDARATASCGATSIDNAKKKNEWATVQLSRNEGNV